MEHFETVRVRKDGTTIDVSVTISPIKNSSGAIVGASKVARDITERKRAEEALRHSDARRGFALETAKLGDWELDATTLQATRSLLHDQIFGYQSPPPEWSFDIFLRHVHPDDRDRVRETFRSSAGQGTRWEFECKILHPSGDIRWIWACGNHYRDASGKAPRMFGVVQDITERKQVETALAGQAEELSRQAEELIRSRQDRETQTLMLQSVLDSMSEGLVVANEEGKFIVWNPAAEKILGFGATKLPSEAWTAHYGFFLTDTVTPLLPEQDPLIRAIHGEVCTAEMFVRNPETPAGAWIEANASPLRDKNGIARGGVVAFRDITQSKADGAGNPTTQRRTGTEGGGADGPIGSSQPRTGSFQLLGVARSAGALAAYQRLFPVAGGRIRRHPRSPAPNTTSIAFRREHKRWACWWMNC